MVVVLQDLILFLELDVEEQLPATHLLLVRPELHNASQVMEHLVLEKVLVVELLEGLGCEHVHEDVQGTCSG